MTRSPRSCIWAPLRRSHSVSPWRLKSGVIDGAANNYPSCHEKSHYAVAKHYWTADRLIIPECLKRSQRRRRGRIVNSWG